MKCVLIFLYLIFVCDFSLDVVIEHGKGFLLRSSDADIFHVPVCAASQNQLLPQTELNDNISLIPETRWSKSAFVHSSG